MGVAVAASSPAVWRPYGKMEKVGFAECALPALPVVLRSLPRCPALRSPRRLAGWPARCKLWRPAGLRGPALQPCRASCAALLAALTRSSRAARAADVRLEFLSTYGDTLSYLTARDASRGRRWAGRRVPPVSVHAHHSAGAPPRAAGTYGRVRTPQRARTRVHLRQAVPAGPVSANSGRLVPAWCAYGGPTVKARAI